MKNQTPKPPAVQNTEANTMRLTLKPGESECQVFTEAALNAAVSCSSTAADFLRPTWKAIGLTEAMQTLLSKAKAVHGGDMKDAETVLVAQATTLNAIFVEMARRANLNMGQHMDAMETYLKLAMKAQNQSRMTLETLAAIKNPPVVYAKQANFANGHQQVNNGMSENRPVSGCAPAGKAETPQNELLKDSHGERMDLGAQAKAGGADPLMETVGEVHPPKDTRGKGKRLAKRVQGQPAPT